MVLCHPGGVVEEPPGWGTPGREGEEHGRAIAIMTQCNTQWRQWILEFIEQGLTSWGWNPLKAPKWHYNLCLVLFFSSVLELWLSTSPLLKLNQLPWKRECPEKAIALVSSEAWMSCCLSAGRFLPTPGLFLCLILAKGNSSLEGLWWLYNSCWSLTWRLLPGDNSSEHARFWHYYLLLISLMISTSLFLNTQKGNAQGLHCVLTNHIDCFGVSLLYRQNPEQACSSKVSPLTPEHIYMFCFVLPMAVQQNSSPWLFSTFILFSCWPNW